MQAPKFDPRTWNLGAKIGVTLVLAAIVPMAIVSVAATRAGQSAVEKAELANALSSAYVGASSVSEYLNAVSSRTEQLGTSPDVVSFLAAPAKNAQPAFGAAKSSNDVRSILVLDLNGDVVAGQPASTVGQNHADDDWFKVGVAGKTSLGQILPDVTAGRYQFTVASPARQLGAEPVGVVSIGVGGDDVLSALSQSPLIPGGQVLLVDHGRVVVARDTRYQGQTLNDLGLNAVGDVIDGSAKGTIAKVNLPGHGVQVVAWATTTSGAKAVVIEPRSVFLASIDRLARTTRIALVIVALIAIGIAIAVARRLSRPVHALTIAAQAVEADEEPDAEVLGKLGRSRDDIGLLSRVFMDMAERVAVRERKLREQVKAMRVEIDEGRRKETVDDLVESDFFKELETRATEIRQSMKVSNDEAAAKANDAGAAGADTGAASSETPES